jgi:integrase/recombinase XerD
MSNKNIRRKAKRLTSEQIGQAFRQARQTRTPERDVVLLHLSYGLGLRACEMSRLQWDRHLLDAEGAFTGQLWISGDIAKNGRERTLTIPQPIFDALVELHTAQDGEEEFVIHSPIEGRNGVSPNALAQWFIRFYRDCGFNGVSSHSGRRTFGTNKAKSITKHGGTLRDVQLAMGHACLSSTEEYIDETPAARKMITDLDYAV